MTSPARKFSSAWLSLGTRWLPFADAASDTLPMSRLLRLSLFQISVGMALVMLVGTLNRVMIVELKVPAALVAVMVALPWLFAPLRALIGYKSDHHRSALGWRRVPYIWRGTLMQFGGFAIMPFALLVLAGAGQSHQAPVWVGHLGAAVAFLLVGAGVHTTQTVGLALATDLAPPQDQPKVVGLMSVMLLVGMLLSALVLGELLADYSPAQLIQVVQGTALTTLVLNVTAVWKQEPRHRARQALPPSEDSFSQAWARFSQGQQALRRMAVVALGTMAFGMEDVLLEPYGGEVLGMSVSATTLLTATLALGGLLGFAWASRMLARSAPALAMTAPQVASMGLQVGLPAFAAVILSAPLASVWVFGTGVAMIGLGAGLFAHGTLTHTMRLAPPAQVGLALGAWGAAQATAGGLGMALGGVARDALALSVGPMSAYTAVYALELLLLVLTLVLMRPLKALEPS